MAHGLQMSSSSLGYRRRTLVSVVALLLLTVMAYLPALRGGFIWDDADHLTDNPAVAAPNGLLKIWSSLSVSRYYPLTLSSFWIQRRLWGLAPFPYHATNVMLQAVNTVLLFLLLRRLQVRGAWVAAALWGVHPVNVESVAWVTELKNTQSGLFFLLCLMCSLQFETRRKPAWYLAALVLFAAALLSKPSTVFLPAVLLLCAWWQRGRWQREDLVRVCPFLVPALSMSLLAIIEQQRLVQMEGTTDWSLRLTERFVVAGRALWFYAGKLLWPINVAFVYPRWLLDATNFYAWLPLAATVIVGGVCWHLRRGPWANACVFGLGYFVIALLPVLGFVNIYYFRYSFVADHFSYLASMGFIALIVSGFATLIRRHRTKALLSVTALAVFGGLTWQRAQVFHDDETLWQDTLRKNPAAVLAHNNLGTIYLRRGQLERALVHLQQAVQLSPDYAQIQNNLGIALARLNRQDEAVSHFDAALRLRPNYGEAHWNLARVLEQQGKLDEAIVQLRAAMQSQPPDPDAYLELSRLLVRRARHGEALEVLRHGCDSFPSHLHLANELAWLLATCPDVSLRRPDAALHLARRLCEQTRRRVPEPLDTLAAAYAAVGDLPEAVTTAREAANLAEAQHQSDLAAAIRSRLTRYKNHQPAPVDEKASVLPAILWQQ